MRHGLAVLRLHELVLEMIKTLKVKRNCTAKKNDTCHYNEDSGPGELNAIGPNLRVFWLAKSSTAPLTTTARWQVVLG